MLHEKDFLRLIALCPGIDYADIQQLQTNTCWVLSLSSEGKKGSCPHRANGETESKDMDP